MFKKQNNKITFVSRFEGLESIEECVPKPAKNFIPQWFKDIPNNNLQSVKICPSFPDYFSQGYIIPMWVDSVLKYDKVTDFWNWSTSIPGETKWDTHSNAQFVEHSKPTFNGIEGQFVFKTFCPWLAITPPGWSVLQLPLFYHFNQQWSILPGIIDTDIHHELNQQVLYHGNGKEVIIKCGDPFVLYIPFKRSNKLKHETRYQTEEDKKIFNKLSLNINKEFLPNGAYRKLQRKRDKKD